MNLTFEKIETMTLNFYEEELAALNIVEEVLYKLQIQLAIKGKEMVAIETGEVINSNEIARARGVLDGLMNNVAWGLKNE